MERTRRKLGGFYYSRKGKKVQEGTKYQQGGEKVTPRGDQTFINPYSYESSPEARVQLELEELGIRFAYRYFADGGAAVHTHKLIPDFAPEFTLPDYRTVIMLQGDFYGSLPGVINKNALAYVLLQADGWKAVIWTQSEVVSEGVAVLIRRDLPALFHAAHVGVEIQSPYGHPLTMETRRQYLRGLSLLKKLFGQQVSNSAGGTDNDRHRKLRHIRSTSDTGRYRPGVKNRGPSHE